LTCAASATAVERGSNAVDPTGAEYTTMSAAVVPAGSKDGENGKVTVTGCAKCIPSGPNTYGVPTAVAPAGRGALGDAAIVNAVGAPTAFGGTVTVTPSGPDAVPPAAPICVEVVLVSPGGAFEGFDWVPQPAAIGPMLAAVTTPPTTNSILRFIEPPVSFTLTTYDTARKRRLAS
jgi:hypothetical protein